MTPVNYRTKSGLTGTFTAYGDKTLWNNLAGIYAFAYKTSANSWQVLYVGQTNSFSKRLPNHERWQDAKRLGATHILAQAVPLQADRDKVEATLVAEWQPTLNTQLK